jgi:hypothetical protein
MLAGGYSLSPDRRSSEPELLLWRIPSDWELALWRFCGGKFPEPPTAP